MSDDVTNTADKAIWALAAALTIFGIGYDVFILLNISAGLMMGNFCSQIFVLILEYRDLKARRKLDEELAKKLDDAREVVIKQLDEDFAKWREAVESHTHYTDAQRGWIGEPTKCE